MCSEDHPISYEPPAGESEQYSMVWPSYPVENGMDVRDGHVNKDVNEEDPAPNKLVPASCIETGVSESHCMIDSMSR